MKNPTLRGGPILFVLFLVVMTAAAAAGQTTHGGTPTGLPNILWIGVDQMRYDTPGCNANSSCRTPNIDRLARGGVRFRNAYTPCCLCSPARASMLTGCFAFRHGMGTNCDLYHSLSRELPDPGMLLHRRLQEAGYRCGFAGKWHVGAQRGPADYGFEGLSMPGLGDFKRYAGYEAYLKEAGLTYGAVKDAIYGNAGQKTLLAGCWDGPEASTPAYYLGEYTIGMMSEFARSGRPFLLICQFWGPHPPYLPSPEFVRPTVRVLIRPWGNFLVDFRGKPAAIRRFRADFYRTLPADWSGWREIVGLYYDYTTMIDRQIGRILDRLHELGLDRNTLVVFESDHGDMLGSHGGLFDKGFLYQEDYRIPLIFRWPGRFAGGQVCDELVYNMDILPTILDILGRPDETLDGMSLRPALEGRALPRPREAIYLEFHGIRSLCSQRAIVTRDGEKYIFNPEDCDEVYDLRHDPDELHNLIVSKEHAPRIERLRGLLKQTAARVRDPIADYIAKLFGDWENLSGQFEAAAPVTGRPSR